MNQTQTKLVGKRSQASPEYPVVVLYPTDPRANKLGGIETAISDYIRKVALQTPVRMVGVDAVGDLKPDSWNRIRWNGVGFDFFPLFVQKNLNRRIFPPLNARFIFYLWAKKPRIFSGPAVLNLRRSDHVLPFWVDRRFPLVLTIHGTSENLHLPNESWIAKFRPLYLLLERISLLRADKIFCAVEEGVRYYRRLLGVGKNKVLLIEDWVDGELFAPQNPIRCRRLFNFPLDKKVLLFVGRLEKVKDPDLLLQTFREVRLSRSDVILVLAGEGSEKDRLAARHADLKNDLIFLGAVPHARLPEVLSAADCLLLTSHFEAVCCAVLEALATGLPVVSTAVGDVPKVVLDGISGYVVPGRSASALAQRVLQVLANRPSLSDCRAAIVGFEANAVLQKVEKANQDLAKNFYGYPV